MEVKLGEKDTENYSEAVWGSKQSHTATVSLKLKIPSQRWGTRKNSPAVRRGWARKLQATDSMKPANNKAGLKWEGGHMSWPARGRAPM